MNTTSTADAELLKKLNEAVAAANEVKKTVETAQAELVSRSKTVGLLLLEAKKLHPRVTDFQAFLKKVHGLSLSWAYDLLRLAGGRVADEELRKEARDRQQRSRAKKKIPKPPPKPISVTEPDVTETKRITQSPEVSAEERRAQNAALDATPPKPLVPETLPDSMVNPTQRQSSKALAEFKYACRKYLSQLTDTDWTSASMFWDEYALKRSNKRKVA